MKNQTIQHLRDVYATAYFVFEKLRRKKEQYKMSHKQIRPSPREISNRRMLEAAQGITLHVANIIRNEHAIDYNLLFDRTLEEIGHSVPDTMDQAIFDGVLEALTARQWIERRGDFLHWIGKATA